jgi:C1A family cysteine protease
LKHDKSSKAVKLLKPLAFSKAWLKQNLANSALQTQSKVKADAFKPPPTVDLRKRCPFVYDQGTLGSCTAQALVCACAVADPTFDGSRLFLYFHSRLLDGSVGEDAGSTISSGVRALELYGVCRDALWPYKISRFADEPSAAAKADALDHQVLRAERVDNSVAAMKACLAAGFPIALGIEMYSSILSLSATLTGFVEMPRAQEVSQGGHAVVCVGYTPTHWIMRNSWSAAWGDGGYFYLPLAFLVDDNITSDLWRVIAIEIPTPAPTTAPAPAPAPVPGSTPGSTPTPTPIPNAAWLGCCGFGALPVSVPVSVSSVSSVPALG